MTNSAFKTLTELKNNQTVIKVCFGEPVVANTGFTKTNDKMSKFCSFDLIENQINF